MAFKRPPELPGGGVICVKTATERPENPFQKQHDDNHEQPDQADDGGHNAEAHPDLASRRRAAYGNEVVRAGMILSPRLDFEAHQHDLRDRENDEGDHEQDQAKGDQRRRIEIANGLGEFVGDAGGDRRSRRKSDREILCALPITKVTAIVSPNARPSPSMTPPMTPTRV